MTTPSKEDGAVSKDSQRKDPVAPSASIHTKNRIEQEPETDTSDKETRPSNEASEAATTPVAVETKTAPTTTSATTAASPNTNTATTTTNTPRLYIGNLHPRVTQVHLESLLHARSLAVQQIQFVASSPTTPASFCFVTLPSVADATRAMQLLHGRMLLGRKLRVQPAHAQTTKQGSLGATSSSSSRAPPTARQQQRSVEDRIAAIRDKLRQGR
jgi:RNA recognition motif-containing protein